MSHSSDALAAAFRKQAGYCTQIGSPLWASAMEEVAADIEAGGAFARLLADWKGDVERGALALRLFGGFHHLALAGEAPALAARLPSTDGAPDGSLQPALLETLARHEERLRRYLDHPPQTNEVGRSAIFLGGFLEVAARSGLPLALCEIGASAGLNLCWDRFAYELGPHRWEGDDPSLTLTSNWRGPAPRLDMRPVIASRRACDRRPIDLTSAEARLRLQGYVWPEQRDRLDRLRAAMALAQAMEIQVEQADALDWTARRLAERRPGEAMVIYHSVVLQYFDAESRARFAGMLAEAGAKATAESPLAWLACEQERPDSEFEVNLAYWPGGAEEPQRRRLATAQAHGRWVRWEG